MFFFSSTVTAGTTFWFLNCHIFECKSACIFENLPKNILLDEKHPCGAFGPTIRESKNFSSCFFLLCCCVQRAQRAEIFVFPLGFFFWNGLRTKLEALEISEISQLSLFRGVVRYIPGKKHWSRWPSFIIFSSAGIRASPLPPWGQTGKGLTLTSSN